MLALLTSGDLHDGNAAHKASSCMCGAAFNFPLLMLTWCSAPALAAGCTIVAKVSFHSLCWAPNQYAA